MGRLESKVALITGGARGQGAAEARLFTSEGAKVVITDVLDADGEAVAAEVGGRYLHHDVSKEADWERVVDTVAAEFGQLDVLINNAGIFKPARMVDTTTEHYMHTVEVNQLGVFLGMRTVAKPMINAGHGSIVNISSVAGLVGQANAIAYSATKWAVRGMTRAAANELARFGIRVNSIHPGMIDTLMLNEFGDSTPETTSKMLRGVPMRRMARPEEVAYMALFLASDESSYCTGSEFIVDGGVHA